MMVGQRRFDRKMLFGNFLCSFPTNQIEPIIFQDIDHVIMMRVKEYYSKYCIDDANEPIRLQDIEHVIQKKNTMIRLTMVIPQCLLFSSTDKNATNWIGGYLSRDQTIIHYR